MTATENPQPQWTAETIMSPLKVILTEGMPARAAARLMDTAGVRIAVVVDATGRALGTLAISELTGDAHRLPGPSGAAGACSFQAPCQGRHGDELVLCTLREGCCPLQAVRTVEDGRTVLACNDPEGVALDFQMVKWESLPMDEVRHFLRAGLATAPPCASLDELARRMLDARANQVVIVDAEDRPVGIVSATAVNTALAQVEANAAQECPG